MDLRANTAVDVLIGPFVDITDGNTTEDALTLTQSEIKLSKNGQALAQKSDVTSAVFDDDGYYNCELDATDTNTEGQLALIVHQSANALPVRHEYNVMSEAAWDSLYVAKDTGFMDVNVKAVSEDTTAADNLELACDNYSATRGLSGTALPAVAADGVGGLPISDAGGLDLDSLLGTLTSLAAETKDANVLDQFRRTMMTVENLRSSHTGQPVGDIFFIDPANGDTHASGNRGGIVDPYATIQDCHDNAVTDSNHDTMILLSGAAAGPTTHTVAATTTLSKRYCFLRGPGRDMIITRTGSGDTFAVTGDGIEVSGFQLETAATGAGHGIQATDIDFLKVKNVWINATQGDGVNLLRCDNCQIEVNVFTDTGQGGSGEGVHIVGTAGTANRNHIEGNTFHACAGDAVKIADGTTNQTLIHHNTFEGNAGYGVNIGASSTDAFLVGNHYGGNASGDVLDGGTTTTRTNDEEYAKHSIATEARLAELDAANLPADLDALIATIGVAGAALTDLGGMSTGMKAEVNVEALDVLNVDTFAEHAGVPAATATLEEKITWLYMKARNKMLQTNTTTTLRNDADGADVSTSTVSEGGGTFTRGEFS